jgi:hypothetical protein
MAVITMGVLRETKNYWVYAQEDEDGELIVEGISLVGNIYINKSIANGERIKVTIEPVD